VLVLRSRHFLTKLIILQQDVRAGQPEAGAHVLGGGRLPGLGRQRGGVLPEGLLAEHRVVAVVALHGHVRRRHADAQPGQVPAGAARLPGGGRVEPVPPRGLPALGRLGPVGRLLQDVRRRAAHAQPQLPSGQRLSGPEHRHRRLSLQRLRLQLICQPF